MMRKGEPQMGADCLVGYHACKGGPVHPGSIPLTPAAARQCACGFIFKKLHTGCKIKTDPFSLLQGEALRICKNGLLPYNLVKTG